MNCQCDDEFVVLLAERRKKRMARIDSMPREMRELVHEYGLTVIDALTSVGVRKPNQIRHVVETVLNEFSPTRGSGSSQGIRRAEGIR